MNRKSKTFLIIILTVFIGLVTFGLMIQNKIEMIIYSKIPDEVSSISLNCFDYLLEGKEERVLNLFVDEYKNQTNSTNEINGIIKQLEKLDKPLNMDIIGYNYKNHNGNVSYEVIHQFEFKNHWLVYSSITIKTNDEYKLYRFDLTEIEESLLDINKFTLKNKGILNYIGLIFTILILIFTFVTSAICFGSSDRRKLLWVFLILCGIGSFVLNWTTGQIEFNLLSIGIPSFSLSRSGTYAPILLGFRIPIFAIIYWIKKYKLLIKEEEKDIEVEVVEQSEEISQ